MNYSFGAILISGFLLCAGHTALFAQSMSPEPAGDTPPILLRYDAVTFQPASPQTGEKLTLRIQTNEQLASAEVRWSVNGNPVETSLFDGSSESVELNTPLKSGDVIEVEVIPSSTSGIEGRTIQKKTVCRKAPPTLKLVEQKIEGNTYSARIEAKDPEDQPVALSIEGPPGMAIDDKGAITWKLTEKTSGKFDVKVTGKDKEGGKAELTYSFRVSRK
ncbi:MAG TPA: putative Ig domain-containing protein [Desulfomonilaceae bacterium]|nr:putative Ig domain-containing protein [Desulfomonilaceae bacterium]